MYTGGIDFRKNIDGLLLAYSKLPGRLRRRHQLVIVCRLLPHERRHLVDQAAALGIDSDLQLTGFVPDDVLLALYQGAHLFVFPSLYEGFGLPALEAMHHGRPVFLSRFTSLPEVGGDAACYFDSFDPDHMREVFAAGMARFDREDGAQRGRAHARRFTWERAAAAYLGLYRECLGR